MAAATPFPKHTVTEAWKGYRSSGEKEIEPVVSNLGYSPSLWARHREETAKITRSSKEKE